MPKRKTNWTDSRGNRRFKKQKKVGTKINENGVEVPVYKTFYGKSETEVINKIDAYFENLEAEKEKKEREAEEEKRRAEELKLHPYGDLKLYEVIDQWVSLYFNSYNLADSTKRLYTDAYNKYFKDSDIARMYFDDVTAAHLQAFYNSADIPFSQLKSLNKFLGNFYRHIELTDPKAYRDITRPVKLPSSRKPSNEKKKIDVWEDADLQKVIDVLEGTTLRFLVILAANTGLRVSELRALHYSDIDSNGVLIVNKQVTETSYNGNKGIRITDTKTKSSHRTIPLPDEIMKELAIHKRLHKKEMMLNGYVTDILFSSSNGNYLYKATLDKALKKVYRSIGVPEHPFHSFRKTYLTNLRRAGVPLEEASELAGHSSVEVTAEHYIAVADERKRAANEKILQFTLSTEAIEKHA